MQRRKSNALFQRAKQSIPGGVNSPVRAFKGVGGTEKKLHEVTVNFFKDVDPEVSCFNLTRAAKKLAG